MGLGLRSLKNTTASITSLPSPIAQAISLSPPAPPPTESDRGVVVTSALEAQLEARQWRAASAPPIDARVVNLDPAHLDGHEIEFQIQMHSVRQTGEKLGNLKEIALKAKDVKTRHLAIESLGNATDVERLRLLSQIYNDLPDPRWRALTLNFIVPESPNDATSDFLLSVLNDSTAGEDLKSRALSSLLTAAHVADVERNSNTREENAMLNRVPAAYQGQFKQIAGERSGRIAASERNED